MSRVFVRTLIRAFASTRSTRYWDIPREIDSPRISIVTRAAVTAKCSAAWPAELAPPMIATLASRYSSASPGAAP